MKIRMKITFIVFVGAVACLMAALWWLTTHGFSARDQPAAIEVWIARRLRHLAIPARQRSASNPVPSTPDIMNEARAHFADHCATCHSNNGGGQTPIGRNVYPKAPDLRAPDTQALSDGELFYVIHNGIRFTAMPAWGKGGPEEDLDSWKLVHFIRHLPHVTPEELEEMRALNPKSAKACKEDPGPGRSPQDQGSGTTTSTHH